MISSEIVWDDDFKKCVDFHGHVCPGIAIGYRFARAGLEWLKQNRSIDEELVAVVENDSCAVDAVQVLTGCTFGKGNLLFKDYGKQALTLADRESGDAVRIVLLGEALKPLPEQQELFTKIHSDSASKAEKNRFNELHRRRTIEILKMDKKSLFKMESVSFEFPQKAEITISKPCDKCKEPTMITRLEKTLEGLLCPGCKNKIKDKFPGVKDSQTYTIRSIGFIRTPFKNLEDCPRQGQKSGEKGEVIIDKDMLPAIKDVEKCSHLILLSYFHLARRDKLRTLTPYSHQIRGVFATRSPNRPNPIALSIVELVRVQGNHLIVKGIDCLDETPLIDIKPYSADVDSFPEAVLGWRKDP